MRRAQRIRWGKLKISKSSSRGDKRRKRGRRRRTMSIGKRWSSMRRNMTTMGWAFTAMSSVCQKPKIREIHVTE